MPEKARSLRSEDTGLGMDKRTGKQIVNDVINFIIKDLEKQDPNKTYTVAEIIEGLKEPEIRDKILACYDEKHRPTIAEWERNFTIYV